MHLARFGGWGHLGMSGGLEEFAIGFIRLAHKLNIAYFGGGGLGFNYFSLLWKEPTTENIWQQSFLVHGAMLNVLP